MTKSLLDKISFGVLLLVTFLAPIFFVPVSFISTQFGTSLLFASGVILVVLLYIISGLFYGRLDLPKPSKYILGFLCAVPAVYIFAGVANGFSRMSFFAYTFDINTVGFIVLGFVYLFLVSILFRNKNSIFYSYFAFVLSAIILSLFLLIRIIFGAGVLNFGIFTTLTSTMVGSWNNIGIFFGIGAILSLLTHEMVSVSKFMRVLLTVALFLSLFFLALVNFSTIWIIVAITAFLFILYNLFNSGIGQVSEISFSGIKHKLSKVPLYPAIVFVVSVVFVIWGNTFGGYLATKLQVANLEVRPSFSVTMEIAKNTIKERPLFGSGPNTFTTEWLKWKPDDVVSTVFWNTDFTNGIGLLPTFAVTTGLLGILSWLLFLGFYLYLGVKSIFTRFEESFTKYLLVSSFFVSLYLWIMAFVYMPATSVFILTLFFTGLFFASVYYSGVQQVETKTFLLHPRQGFVSSLIMVTFLLATSYLGYGLYKNSQSLYYFQKSAYALNNLGDIGASEANMLSAISSVPLDVYYRALSEIETVKLKAILSQDPAKVKPEDAQKQFSSTLQNAITSGLLAKNADPDNYLNWISLGKVYEAVSMPELKVNGSYESAQFAYTEALRRNPKNPGILILLSRLATIKKDFTQAENYVKQAIGLKSNYTEAYFLLSQIEVENNNIKGAIDSVTSASVIEPTNSGIFFQLGLLKYNAKDWRGAMDALEKAVRISPDYANAKYFLGLSYQSLGEYPKAIKQFEDLKVTNPDNKEVNTILSNLKAGKSPFPSSEKPEKGKKLPVKESQ